MRFTAVFAVTLLTAVLGFGSTASAAPLPTENTAAIQSILLASEGGIFNPQQASDNIVKAQDEVAEAPEVKEPAKEITETPAEPEPIMVTVQSGDSLSKIATAHNTTWVRIFDANTSITNPNVIEPGLELRIPRDDETLEHREQPKPVVKAATTTRTATSSATSYPVSANAAKAFIYARESGNNPNATNPSGCYGLGQDCNGVLRTMCGADYACQDAYFDRYAAARYGSWEAAYAFWQANHWW